MPLFPDQASTFAPHVDALYIFLVLLSAFFSLLIGTLVVVFAIKYHRRSEGEVPVRVHQSGLLEMTWTVIPFLITMVLFAWSSWVYFKIARPPREAMDVYVTAKQWMWKLQHADGRMEMNELHVPVGRAVRLTMASEDVIHSFYIPAFRFKRDVVPGRFSTAWFEATRPGRYHLFCAEYCGTRHSNMIGWVHVLSPASFFICQGAMLITTFLPGSRYPIYLSAASILWWLSLTALSGNPTMKKFTPCSIFTSTVIVTALIP